VPFATLPDCDVSTGTVQDAEDEFMIFPNPSTGLVQIVSTGILEEIIVTDALGRVIHRSRPGRMSTSVEDPHPWVCTSFEFALAERSR
jgi:hypothetical protein